MSRPNIRGFAGLVAVALVTAACGSTVPSAGRQPAGAELGGASAQDGSATVGGRASGRSGANGSGFGPDGRTIVGPADGGAGTPGAAASGGSANGGPPGGSQLPAALVGPGVTKDSIFIGLAYSSDSEAGNAALGVSGASAGDIRAIYQAAFDYVNDHGGAAGRKLVPLFYDFSAMTTETAVQQQQAACDFWTRDHKVFALQAGNDDLLSQCAERAGALTIGWAGNSIASTYRRFPHYFDANGMRLDRLGPVTVNGLFRQRYFAGKLGLITWDSANYTFAMKHGYLPALAAKGLAPVDVAYAPPPQTFQDLGATSAFVRNTILKWQGLGIDHVIIQDGPVGIFVGGGLTLTFTQSAEAQTYRPRYGMNSLNSPGNPIFPAAQMKNMLAINYGDSDRAADVGTSVNQTRERCFALQRAAGNTQVGSNGQAQVYAAMACDWAFLFQRLLGAAKVVTADAFMSQLDLVGTSFPSALVYGIRLQPGQHDGAAKIRDQRYDDDCSCMVFTSKPYEPR